MIKLSKSKRLTFADITPDLLTDEMIENMAIAIYNSFKRQIKAGTLKKQSPAATEQKKIS